MKRQLFIYYRIPKADIAPGLQCARRLATQLKQQGLGHSQLFQREEVDKPYFTLMEVIYPAPEFSDSTALFTEKLEQMAATCFADLPSPPSRHLELFTELHDEVNG
jgi:hypothetical protein